MKIIPASDPLPVEHPVFLIFGQPGIAKTSLAYSTHAPLLLDFDQGAHRAVNRRDTVSISTWADVADLMKDATALAPYQTIVVDTVGRCLDALTVDIIRESPRLGQSNGILSQQGWGALKARFRTWVGQLRALGKDVLLVAHDKEDKDGDLRIIRPDIVGGSFAEVMKIADVVGYLYMSGKSRVLDCNPTERWVGKNPAQWEEFKIPPAAQAQTFLADLYDKARQALGQISVRQTAAVNEVDQWRELIANAQTLDQLNLLLPEARKLSPALQPQVMKLLGTHAKALGFLWSKTVETFVAKKSA